MDRKHASLAIGALAARLATASLLAGLRHALRRERRPAPETPESRREEQRRRIRAALGDVVKPLDLSTWPEHLRGRGDLPRPRHAACLHSTHRPPGVG